MSKEIWLGPVLGKNRERLLARCAEYIANGRSGRLLYLAASQPLLELITDKLLDGKAARGVWGEFPVYLFRGFVRRILSEARPSGRATQPGEPLLTRGLLTQPFLSEARPSGGTVAQTSVCGLATDSQRKVCATVGLLPRTPIDREELPLRLSLVSQVIKQLSAAGKVSAIRPLANRDGCVNTIASLIGELQRAGKTPDEFHAAIQARAADQPAAKSQVQSPKSKVPSPKSQLDFDRDVALIYGTFTDALNRFALTDDDADQLRALQVLRAHVAQVGNLRLLDREPEQSQINNLRYSIPWLDQIDLLVLDGFFDFTPVQGEILKSLIPRVENVIVNLNHDDHNPEIFRPFASTIDHLKSIAPFEIETNSKASNASPQLRQRLFNVAQVVNLRSIPSDTPATQINNLRYTLLECSDRELEIISIAKEIKRLIFAEGYQLSDIALVVRQRASYADTIVRVMADKSIPCNLQRRVEATDIPSMRACAKLLQLLKEPREQLANLKANEIGHLIKTGYFRPSPEAIAELVAAFDKEYSSLLSPPGAEQPDVKLRAKLGIGEWRPDELENVIAYVGSELRVRAWIDRARKLIRMFPSPEDAQSLMVGSDADDNAIRAADEAPPEDGAVMDRRKKPAPIHPATIAWGVLLMKHFQQLIAAVPDQGPPEELRSALMVALDRLQFSAQVNRWFQTQKDADLSQAALDVRGRESLRRAIAAAVRAFNYANDIVSEAQPQPNLSIFIDEVERSLKSQTLAVGVVNHDGLQVLEATDIRGLRFRAIFVAGMIEGGFPLRMSRDWLYPHEERLRLQQHGIFLEDISSETLLKEEHYFYQVACRATERLYLTRALALEDGAETVPSYYIEELKRAIHPARIEVRQVRGDNDAHEVLDASTAQELGAMLVRQSQPRIHNHARRLSQPVLSGLLSSAETAGYVSASALQRVNIERERNGRWFGPYDGEITNPDLLKMLARYFGPEQVYSASRLSTYGNCSFRFLAGRLLRIEPRTEAALDLQAIDAGKLLHEILRRFFEKHRRDYLPPRDRADLRKELAQTADAVFKEHEDKVPPLNERIWKIDCEIRKLILDQVLLYELRLQEKTNARTILPTYFELAFGRVSTGSDPSSTPEYLKIPREGNAGEVALIQGQIDRVDVSEDRQTAMAYDYKLSSAAKLGDIKAGRELQLPIYLAALEQLFLSPCELGGGGYYILRGGANRLNKGLYRLSHADCTNVTYAKGMLDDVEWQRIRRDLSRRVWEFIDRMRRGDFRVKPALGKFTCKFCDYSAVCRYDTYRISRKESGVSIRPSPAGRRDGG